MVVGDREEKGGQGQTVRGREDHPQGLTILRMKGSLRDRVWGATDLMSLPEASSRQRRRGRPVREEAGGRTHMMMTWTGRWQGGEMLALAMFPR